MKKILFILLSLFLLTSCSTEVEQKENPELLNRVDLVEITESDENYLALKAYSDYLSNDFTGSFTSEADLQVFFDENYSEEKKPKVVCHEHIVDYPDFHYVTVQSNGNYYLVFVNTEYDPPRTIVYPFGAHNPCGQVSSYLP